MATFAAVLVPGKDSHYTVAGTTADAGQLLGARTIFAINANGDVNIVFYNASNAKVPAATNFRIPQGIVATYDLSDYYDSYAVYNPNSGTVDVWTQTLNRG